MVNVLIVDDHPAICFALKAVLEANHDFSVQSVTDGIKAMSFIKDHDVEIVVLDISLAVMDGMEILSRIKQFNEKIKVIILTGQNPEIYSERALRAGADGFVSKDYDLKQIGQICQQVIDGYSCFPSFCLKRLIYYASHHNNISMMEKLSDREIAVLRYLIEGKTNKEIGDLLLLSNKTISTYKSRLFEKTNTTDLNELKKIMENEYQG
ncbi:response regulator transcription factor [Pragia fontium]|uniref:Two-component system, NarL family, response regulator EvgA n=2 Tax=Pragia fontium TaxID=82985 RepID=A0AAJ4WC52_9GAMM|nr:response regulator transcription factor [Pragia fontium]AKJ42629.1 hypothetical protein QQ39_11495 [Pragia fontium]SFD13966.1 two-component system, NarL family, response regulator EvgA [Pragia fontium DSM 5563 = ATCC 49100]SUB82970.1 Virulence factors putative positive transcription regulator BvgA [Pragia fontium]VEJ55870.1 Virulence factors putative positive transcription regulator BvgA [Pragia fontium]GKX62527.1 DNA-binding response regulator [Pragia fontium]